MEKQDPLKTAAAHLKQKFWTTCKTSPLFPWAETRQKGKQCFLDSASSQEKVEAQLT